MTILALDACGRFAISALRRDARIEMATSQAGEGAVRGVYSSVDRALARAGVAANALDAIIVNTGPGSWTATRIAVTYCASLAFGAGVRVFGYSGFAIGGRLEPGGVAFIDQLGKTIADSDDYARTIELFGAVDSETYLSSRRAWLEQMLDIGVEALKADAPGDPIELRTTYFQDFITGVRT